MHSSCSSTGTQARKSLHLLIGNTASLPIGTAYQGPDPGRDLLSLLHQRGANPTLLDNCQIMLTAAKATKKLLKSTTIKVPAAHRVLPLHAQWGPNTFLHSWDQNGS